MPLPELSQNRSQDEAPAEWNFFFFFSFEPNNVPPYIRA